MRASPRVLVFQHIAIEHPGIFRDFLADDGIEWVSVELDEGEAIPSLDDFDALWVMGGPMDTWQVDEHPWLVAEKAAIREAVADRHMPYLGLCLGHQLLADALGGKVGPARQPEIGILDVTQTDTGRASPFLAGLGTTMRCLQWHSAEVLTAPTEAAVLVESPACPIQAMSIGDFAFSTQYHVELTDDTVREWGEVPEYKTALESSLGAGALDQMIADADAAMAEFGRNSRALYDNWMATVFDESPTAKRVASRQV